MCVCVRCGMVGGVCVLVRRAFFRNKNPELTSMVTVCVGMCALGLFPLQRYGMFLLFKKGARARARFTCLSGARLRSCIVCVWERMGYVSCVGTIWHEVHLCARGAWTFKSQDIHRTHIHSTFYTSYIRPLPSPLPQPPSSPTNDSSTEIENRSRSIRRRSIFMRNKIPIFCV